MSHEEAIRATAYEILEDGLFLFLDPATLPMEEDAVAFTMHVAGAELGLRMSRTAASALAAHMLGRGEGEVLPEEVDAAVAEALNMVAGQLVARVVGTEAELDLGLPSRGGLPNGTTLAFDVEGGGLELWYAA